MLDLEGDVYSWFRCIRRSRRIDIESDRYRSKLGSITESSNLDLA